MTTRRIRSGPGNQAALCAHFPSCSWGNFNFFLCRSEFETDNQGSQEQGIVLPPGIESLEQLQRLPAAMQTFLKKQYGIGDTNSANDKDTAEEDAEKKENKPKKQKIKFFPKPPSGPPPAEALTTAAAEK